MFAIKVNQKQAKSLEELIILKMILNCLIKTNVENNSNKEGDKAKRNSRIDTLLVKKKSKLNLHNNFYFSTLNRNHSFIISIASDLEITT